MENQQQNQQIDDQEPTVASEGQSPLRDENAQNQQTREDSDSMVDQGEDMEDEDLEDEDMEDDEDESEDEGMNSQADPARMQQRPQPDEF